MQRLESVSGWNFMTLASGETEISKDFPYVCYVLSAAIHGTVRASGEGIQHLWFEEEHISSVLFTSPFTGGQFCICLALGSVATHSRRRIGHSG